MWYRSKHERVLWPLISTDRRLRSGLLLLRSRQQSGAAAVKAVAADLKEIYRASTAVQAEMELNTFQANWGSKYQAIGKLWKENWARVVPFFEFPAEVRKVIYTTNAVESLHMSLRKIIKTRGLVSERGSGPQADLSGAAERDSEIGHGAGLETGVESFPDAVG